MTTTWKKKSTIEPNPIGIDRETVEDLAPGLDAILASMFVLFHQYQKHHWLVEGPQFRDLHHFLQEGYEQVHKACDQVAERMTALGLVPTSSPTALAETSFIEHEPEGIYRIRDMIDRDREAEGMLARRMREVIATCTNHGDYGTETLLKKLLLKTEDRAHHLDHFLGEDSLALGFVEHELKPEPAGG